MAEERNVAGLRCGEVLQRLSDYVDGAVTAEESAAIAGHLRGCDWCERFGGSFSSMVAELRSSLNEAEPLDEEVEQRLRVRLERVIAE